MFPYLSLFGRQIPMYSVMILFGMLAVMLYFVCIRGRLPFSKADGGLLLVYSTAGVFVGAKALYLVTALPQLAADFGGLYTATGLFLQKYLYSGFVFYGGIYGALAAAGIYCRVCRLPMDQALRWLFPAAPLFHAFGRLGCFCIGCCYGRPVERLGVVFSHSPIAPNGVMLFPSQLVEAAAEAALFCLLLWMALRGADGFALLGVWLASYGVLRFGLEFMRGDAYRGFVGALSLSQVISLVTVAWGIWLLARHGGRRAAEAAATTAEK